MQWCSDKSGLCKKQNKTKQSKQTKPQLALFTCFQVQTPTRSDFK